MADWPADGTTNWNAAMLAYLAVEHNTDGTHATRWPINGTNTRIYTKYLTGNLGAGSETNVAHGIASAITKILSVTAYAYNDGTSTFYFNEASEIAAATESFKVTYDATNIKFISVGTLLVNNAYRIKIDYIV